MSRIQPFTYASGRAPEGYVCEACGAKGVRLYRPYSSFRVELKCTACTQKEQGKELTQRDHSCGWMVCAVPDESDGTWWGFTSIPEAGVRWWDGLPKVAA